MIDDENPGAEPADDVPPPADTPAEPDAVPEPPGAEAEAEPAPAEAIADAEPATADPEPGAPTWPGPLAAAIDGLAERLGRRLDALQSAFDREIRAEATREKVVDRLHAELQEYKNDLLLNTLRPVFLDLIQLHDDIGKVAVAAPDAAPEVARLVGLMDGFRQGIEDILYRQGVEPFEEPGDAFDPRRQRAVATVATDDPALNKAVAARLRKGFRSGDRVIRPEIVSVYAYKA